jgi:hypothetical protein
LLGAAGQSARRSQNGRDLPFATGDQSRRAGTSLFVWLNGWFVRLFSCCSRVSRPQPPGCLVSVAVADPARFLSCPVLPIVSFSTSVLQYLPTKYFVIEETGTRFSGSRMNSHSATATRREFKQISQLTVSVPPRNQWATSYHIRNQNKVIMQCWTAAEPVDV